MPQTDMDDAITGSLAGDIGYLLKEAQVLLHARMDEVLRPLGLTVSQYSCLATLRQEPGITSSELARRAFVSRQSMNVLLHGLSERGLVSRAEQPGPRNQIAAELTPAAGAILDDAHARVATVVGGMTVGMRESELEALRASLIACRNALS